MNYSDKYKCKHCEGIVQITIIEDTKKAIVPKIEFCPFCGMLISTLSKIESE